jgi:hypothetical protein
MDLVEDDQLLQMVREVEFRFGELGALPPTISPSKPSVFCSSATMSARSAAIMALSP